MMNRRSVLTYGSAAALGTLGLGAVAGEASPALADEADHGRRGPTEPYPVHSPLPDPATTVVPSPAYPRNLTHQERRHLETFDELDFEVFTHAEWSRLGESHAQNIRVHMPDGTFTDGLDAHLANLKALFVWAPDTRIQEHPIRVAKNDLTAVTGVMRGTFTKPMTLANGAVVPPNGKKYAINMATIGSWNAHGVMDEEWLFWDNLSFFAQLGLA